MTAPHSDRDRSGDPLERPFWPPAHRHAIETQRERVVVDPSLEGGPIISGDFSQVVWGDAQQPVNAESVARGQQQVIEAQRERIAALTSAAARVVNSTSGDLHHNIAALRAILDAAPNETGDEPA